MSTLLEGLSVLQTGEGGTTRMHGSSWENPDAHRVVDEVGCWSCSCSSTGGTGSEKGDVLDGLELE